MRRGITTPKKTDPKHWRHELAEALLKKNTFQDLFLILIAPAGRVNVDNISAAVFLEQMIASPPSET